MRVKKLTQVIRVIPHVKHFFQRYNAFLVGHSTRDVAVITLLRGFFDLEKRPWSWTFENLHETEREFKNISDQLLKKFVLTSKEKCNILYARYWIHPTTS